MKKTLFLSLLFLFAGLFAYSQGMPMVVKNSTPCSWYVWFSSPRKDCKDITTSKMVSIAPGATVTFATFGALSWPAGSPNPAYDWDAVYVLNPCHGTSINYATACSSSGAFEGLLLATGRACTRQYDYACVDVTPCGSCNYVKGKLVNTGSTWLLDIHL